MQQNTFSQPPIMFSANIVEFKDPKYKIGDLVCFTCSLNPETEKYFHNCVEYCHSRYKRIILQGIVSDAILKANTAWLYTIKGIHVWENDIIKKL